VIKIFIQLNIFETLNKLKKNKKKINDFIMSLFIILPNEILKLIQQHLQATVIQSIFKLHRPLSILECGNRVMILDKKNYKKSTINNTKITKITKMYGTIIEISENFSKIKLLPRIIPHWKRCNINFWNNYQYFLKDYSFPYYTPKSINVSNDKIIKLNNWNDKINVIDGSKRVTLKGINGNSFKKSNMFGYYF
jgi:hypothetical protein